MRKITIIALIFLNSLGLYAHNAQISTVALVQGKDKKWHMIISASLSAFQYELKNSDQSINLEGLNADKFQNLILKHLREKVEIEANGQRGMLRNARVILGHQTDINFEVTNMPENLQNIDFQQLGFSTLRDHFCIFKIITINGNANSFMLQKENNYSVSLASENNILVEKVNQNNSNILIYSFLFLCLGILIVMYFKTKKNQFIHAKISSM